MLKKGKDNSSKGHLHFNCENNRHSVGKGGRRKREVIEIELCNHSKRNKATKTVTQNSTWWPSVSKEAEQVKERKGDRENNEHVWQMWVSQDQEHDMQQRYEAKTAFQYTFIAVFFMLPSYVGMQDD